MRVRDLGTLILAVDAREQPVVGSKAAAMLASAEWLDAITDL